MKCRKRWVDPLWGRSRYIVGPFSCGRPAGHPGLCAHVGHGAWALWSGDELFMSITRGPEEEPDEATQSA